MNLSGDYATPAAGPHYLTAGPFNLLLYTNVTLQFSRWLNVENPPYASATIQVSANGSAWSNVWNNTATVAATSWTTQSYNLSTWANRGTNVYVRWGHQTGANAWAFSGWNIDDVVFTGDGPAADLAVAASSLPGTLFTTSTVTFVTTITNSGALTAAVATVSLVIPTNQAMIASADSTVGICGITNGTVTCALGDFPSGSVATVTVVATNLQEGTLSFTAVATTATPETSTANNLTVLALGVVDNASVADLGLGKSGPAAPVPPNTLVNYRIVVTNAGPHEARNVTVADTLPPGLAFFRPGPIIYYPCRTNEAPEVRDASGFGCHGTLANGVAYTSGGRADWGLAFDGANDFVTVPHSAGLVFTNTQPITVSAWIKPAAIASFNTVLAKGRTATGSSAANYIVRLESGKLSFYYRNAANTAWHVYNGNTVLSAGNWYHLAVTYTFGNGASMIGYVNGLPENGGWLTGSTGNEAPSSSTEELRLGAIAGATEPFSGVIDEVRIYDRILAAGEIAALCQLRAETSGPWTPWVGSAGGTASVSFASLPAGAVTSLTLVARSARSQSAVVVTNSVAAAGTRIDTNLADNAAQAVAALVPPQTPFTGSAPQLWLQADTYGAVDGATVPMWADASTNARDAVQATFGYRPTYRTNAWGAVPAMRFDGSDDVMSVADSPVWAFTNFNMFAVVRPASTNIPQYWTKSWLAQDTGSGANNKWIWGCDSTSLVWHVLNTAGGNVTLFSDRFAPATNRFNLFELRKNGSTYEFFDSGVSRGQRTSSVVVPNIAVPLTVGRAESGSFNGDIAEILVYDRALGEAERNQAGAYLEQRYGLSTLYVGSGTQSLVVASAQGMCDPAPGWHKYPTGTAVVCSITNAAFTVGATQSVATGWTLTGHEPPSGSGTNCTLVVTNNAALTWNWQTRYYLDLTTSGPGSLSGSTSGWYTAGGGITVTGLPSAGYVFSRWTGNTNGCTISSNVLSSTMSQARAIAAVFTNPVADLAVAFAGSCERAVPGNLAAWTLVVSNLGPQAVTGGVVSNALPAAILFSVSNSPTAWQAADGLLARTFGPLAAGASTTLVWRGYLPPGTAIGLLLTNLATVCVDDPRYTDPNAANNVSTNVRTARWPRWIYDFEDLALGSMDNQDGWLTGGYVQQGSGANATKVARGTSAGGSTYPIRTNDTHYSAHVYAGMETNAIYQFDSYIPVGVTGHQNGYIPLGTNGSGAYVSGPSFYLSDTQLQLRQANGGTSVYCALVSIPGLDDGDWIQMRMTVDFTANAQEGAGVLSCRNLTDGQTAFLPVLTNNNLQIKTRTINNGCPPSAWKSAQFRFDGNVMPLDNLKTGEADLDLAASQNTSFLAVGGNLVYTLTVTNRGPLPALDVRVSDLLPDGLSFVSATSSQGACSQEAGFVRCFLNTISNGGSATVQVTATASREGTFTNRCIAFSMVDDDTNTLNNATTLVATAAPGTDLRVVIADEPDPMLNTETLAYTLAVTNVHASRAATAVVVTNLLAPEAVFQTSGSTPGWSVDGRVATFALGDVAPGAGTTLTLRVTVGDTFSGVLTNVVSVAGAMPELTAGDNHATAVTTVRSTADLGLLLAAAPGPATAGASLVYTFTVTNAGAATAAGVVVTGLLPAAVSPGGAWATNLGSIAGHAVVVFTRTVAVSPAFTGWLTNRASVSGQDVELAPADNAATLATLVQASADLVVLARASAAPATAGAALTYTITATNSGPSDAAGVVISNFFDMAVVPGGAWNTALPVLAAGQGTSFVFAVTVEASFLGTLTNVAVIAAATTDPAPDNNATNLSTAVQALADLRLWKSDSPDPVLAGATLTYALVVSNAGPSDATAVQITDTLPVGVTPGGTLVTNLGLLCAGASTTVAFTVAVDAATQGTFTNAATVAAATGETSPGNNTATAATTVWPASGISLTMTDAPDPALVGTTVAYTLTISNAGPSAAAATVVTNTLPVGTTFNAGASTSGGTLNGGRVSYAFGTLPAGAVTTLTVAVDVPMAYVAAAITNAATVASASVDVFPADNAALADTALAHQSDLGLILSAAPDPVSPTMSLTWTMTVTNSGPTVAPQVEVNDIMPAGVSFSGVANPGWSESGGIATYAVGSLPVGASTTLTLRVTVLWEANLSLYNVAVVSTDASDPAPENDGASSVSLVTKESDLSIALAASPEPVSAGGTLAWTIAVSNAGPGQASGVTVNDTLPPHVTFSAGGSPGWSIAGGVASYDVGNVAIGAVTALTLRATVDADAPAITITNRAALIQNNTDPDASDNLGEVASTIGRTADLSVTLTDTPDPVAAGGNGAYLLVVSNAGPSLALAVTLTDTLPAGVTFRPAGSTAGGSVNGSQVTYSLGACASGDAVNVTICYDVPASLPPGILTNRAVAGTTSYDPASGNNTAEEQTAVTRNADLRTIVLAETDPVGAGDTARWILRVCNDGPSDASGVVLTNTLPEGAAAADSGTTPGYTADGRAVSWSVGALAVGGRAQYLLAASVTNTAYGALTNTLLAAAATADSDPADNATSAVTAVALAAPTRGIYTFERLASGALSGQDGWSGSGSMTITNGNALDTAQVLVFGGAASAVRGSDAAFAFPTALSSDTNAVFQFDVQYRNQPYGHVEVRPESHDPWGYAEPTVFLDMNKAGIRGANGNSSASAALPAGANDGDWLRLRLVINFPGYYGEGTADLYCRNLTDGDTGFVKLVTLADLYLSHMYGYQDPFYWTRFRVASDFSGGPINNLQTTEGDLSLTMVTAANRVEAGALQVYSLIVSNRGPMIAQNIRLVDRLPAGAAFGFASVPATQDGPLVRLALPGTLAPGAATTVTLELAPTPVGTMTNVADVACGFYEPDFANNRAQASTAVDAAAGTDLVLTQSVAPTALTAGVSQVSYTVAVSNAGSRAADNVTLTVVPPTGLSPAATVVTNIGALAAGAGTTRVFVYQVLSGSPLTLSHFARVACDLADNHEIDNRVWQVSGVTRVADLAVVSAVPLGNFTAGAYGTLRITVTNAGPSDALSPVISYGCSSGLWASPSLAALAALAANGSVVFDQTVSVDEWILGAASVVATASSEAADANAGNNAATASITVVAAADLALSVTVSPSAAAPSTFLTYSMNLRNYTPSDARNVVISNVMPAGVTFDAAGSPGWTLAGSVATYALGTFAGDWNNYNYGITRTLRVAVDADSGGLTLTNAATVYSSTPDGNTANNTVTRLTPVYTNADVSITVVASPDPLSAGQTVTYVMTVANSGPGSAFNVTATNMLPEETTFVSSGSTEGATQNGRQISYALGTLSPGASISRTVAAQLAAASGASSVTALVSVASTMLDLDTADNATEAVVAVNRRADLAVARLAPPQIERGEVLPWTLYVANSGPSDAVGVVLTNTLPAGLAPITNATTAGFAVHGRFVSWTLGALASGASTSLTLTVQTETGAAAALTNVLTVGATTMDPAAANNATTNIDALVLLRATQGLYDFESLAMGNLLPQDGWTAWPGHAGNAQVKTGGGANATRVLGSSSLVFPTRLNTATFAFPTSSPQDQQAIYQCDVRYQYDTAGAASVMPRAGDSAGPCFGVGGRYFSIRDSHWGDSVTRGIWAGTDAGDWLRLRLVVDFTAPGGRGTLHFRNLTDGQSAYSVAVENVDLQMSRMGASAGPTNWNGVLLRFDGASFDVDNLQFTEGDTVVGISCATNRIAENEPFVCTLTATNKGPMLARDLTLVAQLPAGFVLDAVAASGALWTQTNDIVRLVYTQQVAVGSAVSATLTAHSSATGSGTLYAAVRSAVYDPNAADNAAQLAVTVAEGLDLGVSQQVLTSPVVAGQYLSYAIAVTNLGSLSAANVTVTDTLSPGVQPGGQVVRNLGALAPGAAACTTVTVFVAAGTVGPLTNRVSVTSDSPDPVTGNNTAMAVCAVAWQPDLLVVQSVAPIPPTAGNYATYAVMVSNAGPSYAAGVVVTAALPAQVTFNGAGSPGWGQVAANLAACTVGTLANSRSTNLTLRVAVSPTALAPLTNTVWALTASGDPVPTNNTNTLVSTVQTLADLAIGQTDSPDPATAGHALIYTVSLTNYGPSDALGVVVTSTLPATATLDGAGSPGWNAVGGGLAACNVGALPFARTTNLTLRVILGLGAPAVVTNRVTAGGLTGDIVLGNNTHAATTAVAREADLVVWLRASADPVLAGQALAYAVAVTNLGPCDLTGVVVTSTLPAQATLDLAGSPGWSPAAGNCATYGVGALGAGAGVSLPLRVTVSDLATGTLTNRALSGAAGIELDAGNNTAQETTAVTPLVDLAVAGKTVPAVVHVTNATFQFVVAITNTKAHTIAACWFTNAFPTNLTLAAADVSQGACVTNHDSVVGALGALEPRAAATLTLTMTNLALGTFTNHVVCGGAGVEATPSDNVADVVVTVIKAPQTITCPDPGGHDTTNTVVLSATASSGLPVSFAVVSGPGQLDGATLTFTGAGSVSIAATQDGNGVFAPAAPVTNTLAVVKAMASGTLNSLSQTYDGTARAVTGQTSPAGLTLDITYDAHSWAPTNAGSYAVTGTVSDAMYQGVAAGTLVVAKAVAGITLTGLAQTYDGTPRNAGATTVPPGLSLSFTYDGFGTAPVNAGSYAVTGTVSDINYAGAASGVLVVDKAAQMLVFANPGSQETTNTVTLSASATSGLPVSFTLVSGPAQLDGATLTFTGAGSVFVAASQAGNGNWFAAVPATNALDVAKAVAGVTLNNLSQTYNGAARTVTGQTSPTGLTLDITYDGHAWAPTNAGSYAVTGTVVSAMYQGTANGTLVVAKADQTITFANPGDQVTSNVVALAASASSGLPVSFSVTFGAAALDGAMLTFSGTGLVGVAASQTGNGNWNTAPGVTNAFRVTKPLALVTLLGLAQLYDGTARMVTATTVPGGLTVDITYDGTAVTPTNAGNYAVTGTVVSAIYEGTAAGTLVVAKAAAAVTLNSLSQVYDGTARVVTGQTSPTGLTVDITCDGHAWAPTNAGSYAVTGTVVEANYQGSTNGTLVVARAEQTITFANPGDQVTTNVVALSASASSALPVTFRVVSGSASLDGATLTFSGAGSVIVAGDQSGDGNWNAAASISNTFSVTKAVAGVTLHDLGQTYDGTVRMVTATTLPAGLPTNITYNGSGVAPTNAGNYAVTGTVVSAIYEGTATGTLVVAKAEQTITFANPGDQVTTNVVALSASASSALPVTFRVVSGSALLDGATLTFSGAGSVIVAGDQSGDGNWNAAASISNTFSVTKAVAGVMLHDLSQTYNGTARMVTATTLPTGLPTNITYNGSGVAPTNAGNYAVTGTVVSAMYQGTATGTLVVAKAEQTITFANPGDQVTTNVVTLSASASSALPVTFRVVSGSASLDGATLTFSGAGSVIVAGDQSGDGNWNAGVSISNTFSVTKAVAGVTLHDLSQAYNGTARIVTATTLPTGLPTNITYNGSTAAPTNAGSYAVTGSVVSAMYQGMATGTLVVAKADQTITFSNPGNQVTTNVVALSASATSALPVTFRVVSGSASLDGATLTFSGAGSVTVAGDQSGDGNWNAGVSISNTFSVTKAVAGVTLHDLSQAYNGTARIVTATTLPTGLPTNITYNGSAAAPTNAGSYAVTGTVVSAMYQGTATGTLVVAKADQTITFANPGDQVTTNVVTLSASATSALPVTFRVVSGSASLDGATLTFSGAGSVIVAGDQSGDGNWNAGASISNTFGVTKAVAGVTLHDLGQTYNGTARMVTATTLPTGLPTNITYNGSAAAPTNAGSYAVTGTVVSAMYQGTATGTLVVAKADQTITFANPGDQVTTNVVTLSASATSALPVTFRVVSGSASLDGATLTFSGAGSVIVAGDQSGDGNWNAGASISNTFSVTKAVAGVTLHDLSQTYNGTARMVTATTLPTGLPTNITYNGTGVAPTNAGNYAVTGTVVSAMYQGTAAGTLVVNKAGAAVTLQNLSQIENGTARVVTSTTAPPGLTVVVTYDGHAWAPTNAGTYAVTATVTDVNYQGQANGTLSVTRLVDLGVRTTASPDLVWAGNALTYIIAITNLGPSTAVGLVVTDSLPAQVTYRSAGSTPGWSIAGSQATFAITSLGMGAGTNLALAVRANPAYSGPLTNQVHVADVNTDPVPANNTTSLVSTVVRRANLAVSKTAMPDPVVAGSNLTYIVTVTNLGPSDASGVVVSNTIAAAAGFFGSASPGWTHNAGVAVHVIGTLGAESGTNLTLTVAVDSAMLGVLTDQVCVASETIDPVDDNNTATNTATVIARADLVVFQMPTPLPPVAGLDATYAIMVTNRGPSDAVGVVVTDAVPAFASSFVGAPAGWVHAGGRSSFVVGRLKSGTATNLTLQMSVASGATGNLTNGVTVCATTTDPAAANNATSHVVAVDIRADVRISKADLNDPVTAGLTNLYAITVTNAGPSDAVSLVITDALPASVIYNAVGSSSGWTPNGSVLTRSLASLAAGQGVSYMVNVTVAASALGLVTNRTGVTSASADPQAANNVASETTLVQGLADLRIIALTAAPDPVYVGSNVTYTISITNAGPSDAVSLVVTDALPATATYVTSTGWSHSSGTATYPISRLAAGARTNFSLVATASVSSGADLTNWVSVSSSTTDTNAANNATSIVTRVISSADLAVGVTASATTVLPGDPIIYTIAVTNRGPMFAAGVIVTSTLPSFVRVSVSGGTAGWTTEGLQAFLALSLLTNGARTNVTLKIFTDPLTVSGSVVTNVVRVGGKITDPNMLNNVATNRVTVSIPSRIYDFETLTTGNNLIGQDNWKRDDSQSQAWYTPPYNAPYTEQMTVTTGTGSNGTRVARSVDNPADLSDRVLAMRPNNAAFAFPRYSGAETNATFQFDVQCNAVVWREVYDFGGGMVSTNFGTNWPQQVRLAPLVTTNRIPDYPQTMPIGPSFGLYNDGAGMNLALWPAGEADSQPYTTRPLPSTVGTGDWLRVKLTLDFNAVANNGAGIVTMQNLTRGPAYPVLAITNNTSGLNLSYITNPEWGLGYTPNVWTGAWIDVAHYAGITGMFYMAEARCPVSIDNIAMGEADLGITKRANTNLVSVGSNIVYTVAVTNRGPLNATGTKVVDMLPDGMTFVGARATRGAFVQEAGVITWTVGTLTNGLGATLTVTGMPTRAGSITNRAMVVSDLFDGTATNNTVALVTAAQLGPYSVQVTTPFSTTVPAAGTYTKTNNEAMYNAVISPVAVGSYTQRVATGWAVTGHTPGSAAGTNFTLTVTNHAVVSWLWSTNVAFSRAAGANGSVSGSTSGWYTIGSSVSVTAAPSANYRFAAWTGDVQGSETTNNPLTLALSRAKSVTATFAALPVYTVQVVSAWSTTVPPTGSYARVWGSTMMHDVISPAAAGSYTQYQATGWTLTGHAPAAGAGTNMTFAVTNNAVLTWLWSTNVSFSRTAGANGSVNGSASGWYTIGSSVSVTAAPNSGHVFAAWTGDVQGGEATANPLTLTLGRARSVTATFVPGGAPQYTVQVVSPYGTATPAVGAHLKDSGTFLAMSVGSPAENDMGNTQYVATGWTLTGHTPGAGMGTAFSFTVTNHATATWLWGITNAWFSRAGIGGGTISGAAAGWHRLNTNISVTAVPNLYYHFGNWQGDTQGDISNSVMNLLMSRTRSVTAFFGENLAANHGTPHWWLAQYGLTNDFDAQELLDPDHDTVPTWQENVAGTDPTRSNSVLAVAMQFSPAEAPVLQWPTVTGRLYSVDVATSLTGPGGGFVTIASNITAGSGSYTDTVSRGSSAFYRIGVKK